MAHLLEIVALALFMAFVVPAFAGSHHAPMAPAIADVCAPLPATEVFDCLHPGYAEYLSDTRGLAQTFSSSSMTRKYHHAPDGTTFGPYKPN